MIPDVHSESGQTLLDYAFIVSIVAVGLVLSVGIVTTVAQALFDLARGAFT
jgi:Flp pilus assembly pilin Flp